MDAQTQRVLEALGYAVEGDGAIKTASSRRKPFYIKLRVLPEELTFDAEKGTSLRMSAVVDPVLSVNVGLGTVTEHYFEGSIEMPLEQINILEEDS